MIRVLVEVLNEGGSRQVAVWSESIKGALSHSKAHFPGSKVSIVFPIEPESFFADGTVPLSEAVYSSAPEQAAESTLAD